MIPLLDLALTIISLLILVFGVLSTSHPNIVYAVFALLALNVLIALLYYIIGAPLVAAVQLSIFSGAVIILFLLVIMMTRGGKWR